MKIKMMSSLEGGREREGEGEGEPERKRGRETCVHVCLLGSSLDHTE